MPKIDINAEGKILKSFWILQLIEVDGYKGIRARYSNYQVTYFLDTLFVSSKKDPETMDHTIKNYLKMLAIVGLIAYGYFWCLYLEVEHLPILQEILLTVGGVWCVLITFLEDLKYYTNGKKLEIKMG